MLLLLPRLKHTSRILPRKTHLAIPTRRYTMAPVPTDLRPIIISGPSGVGKGTLYKLLLDRHPNTFATSISHTTREPRPGETRDVDYYYTDMATFEAMIDKGGFVEHAKFGGNRYGTSKKMIGELTAGGRVCVLDIEMEGVKQIKTSHLSARYIFIAPPSMEILESRLRNRGTEKEESIQKRLAQAKNELDYSKVEGVHDLIIVNDDLEEAYKKLEEFVFKGEGAKAS
ncbi:P-loop containing nucleoside triphosphate hydrolase protein [Leptodontidium sp. 2 PMI_412]|nr:P-loop containing nucleoside triphosphate hydrolase protein [Leptodontidium sp. 2 PMI_412]